MSKLTSFKLSDFTGRDTAKFIKYQLMKYLRFQRKFIFACSECVNNADITGLDANNLIEIEIKISKADFLKEFDGESRIKSYKHKVLQSLWAKENIKTKNNYVIPNYFYFCVTPEIKNFVIDFLKEKGYNGYGVLLCNENRIPYTQTHIECIKTPKKVHNTPPSDTVFYKVGKRVQSEMLGLIEKEITNINSKTTRKTKKARKNKK